MPPLRVKKKAQNEMFRAQILASSSGTLRLSVSFGGASSLTKCNKHPTLRLSEKFQKITIFSSLPAPSNLITVIASWKQLTDYPSPFALVRLPILDTAINIIKKDPAMFVCSATPNESDLHTNLLALTRRSCTASMYLVFNRLPVLSRSIRGGVRC